MLVLKGSRNYNLHTEESDYDYVNLYAPTLKDLWLGARPEETKKSTDADVQNMDVRHFLHLLEKGNHNALELLFSKMVQEDGSLACQVFKLAQKNKYNLLQGNLQGFYWSLYGSMKSEVAWLEKNPDAPAGKRMAQVLRWYYVLKYVLHMVYTEPSQVCQFKTPNEGNPFWLEGESREEVMQVKASDLAYWQMGMRLTEVMAEAAAMKNMFNTSKSEVSSDLKEFTYKMFESQMKGGC